MQAFGVTHCLSIIYITHSKLLFLILSVILSEAKDLSPFQQTDFEYLVFWFGTLE